MAAARRAPARSPMARPQPGTASRDYTQPPPGGPTYPWGPGGTSKTPGVPDNWRDYYPSEGAGRGDAWLGPKFGPGGRLNEQTLGPRQSNEGGQHGLFVPNADGSLPTGMEQYKPGMYGGHLGPDVGPTRPRESQQDYANRMIAHQQQLNQQYVGAGGTRPGFTKGGPLQGTPLPNPRPSGPLTYQPGGPYPPAAGGPGAGGTNKQAWEKMNAAYQKSKTAAPAAAPDYAKIRSGMKAGQTQKIGGKSYFLNEKGALVDVSDPKNRKRLTDIQGNVLGAKPAAAPPPPTQAPAQTQGLIGTTQHPLGTQFISAPNTPDPNAIPPWAQQMQDSFAQMLQQQQRPSYYPGASPMDPYGGGMNFMGGFGGGQMNGIGFGPMQNFMGGFGGGFGGFQNDMMGYGGGMGGFGGFQAQPMGGFGGGYGQANFENMMQPQSYFPEASMMNPYNPNQGMYDGEPMAGFRGLYGSM